MKKRDYAARIALAGIGTAISLVMVVLAYYVKVVSISFYVLSAAGVMLPLTQKYYREAILTAIAVSVAGFFIVNLNIVPFVMASGFYVVFTVFWQEKNLNILLGYGIKFLYSCLIFFICYWVIKVFAIDVTKINFLQSLNAAGLYILLNGVFSAAFLLYDFLLLKGYIYLRKLVSKIIKNKN